jgi:hypothetical protein
MNYARTQWKLALHWQGSFFFGELDARPCHIPVPPTRRRDDDGDEGYGNITGTIGRDQINLHTDPSGTTEPGEENHERKNVGTTSTRANKG